MCLLSYFLLSIAVGIASSESAVDDNQRGLADAVVNTQILTVFTYKGNQIYVYGALSNENENRQTPQKWIFYYVPVMLPIEGQNNSWITSNENELRATLDLGNAEVEDLARRAVINKYDYQTGDQYSKYWDIAPLMIDSLTGFIIKSSTNIPAEGVHPFSSIHPNTLTMTFRFECSTRQRATEIVQLLKNGDYSIEIAFYFAGFKQITTNFISITGNQMKSVFSKTIADGNNTNAQYIHRNQATQFLSSYMLNVKKMIYMENQNTNTSALSAGLEDQFISLLQQGMDSMREIQLDAKLYDQVWSSSDLNPDRITSEMQSIFTYNETETQRRNHSDIYFDFDRQQAQSNAASGAGGLSGAYKLFSFSLFGGGSSSSSSSQSSHTTTHEITTASDIQHFTDKQSVETAWTGEKWIPKSFKLFKLTDINDALQVALVAKQVMAEKQNGAIIRNVNTMHSPILTISVPLPPMLTGEGKLYFGVTAPPLPWLLCNGAAISRIKYQRLFSVIGNKYGQGDGVTTFNLPDFRGRVPVGVDQSSLRNVGMTGGTRLHQLTVEQLPSHVHLPGSLSLSNSGTHSHSLSDPGHNHGGSTGAGPQGFGNFLHHNAGAAGQNQEANHTHSIKTDFTRITIHQGGDHIHNIMGQTSAVGLGQQFSLMQPFQTVNYIIYAD